MRSPLKLAQRRAPESPEPPGPPRPLLPVTPKTRRIAAISSVCAVIVGVGTGSALFVDYLADRAMARAANTIPVKVVREIRIASDSSIASDAIDGEDSPPVVRPPEIVTTLPVPPAPAQASEVPESDIDAVETAALDPDAADPSDVLPSLSGDAEEDMPASDDVATSPSSDPVDKEQKSASLPPEPAEEELASLPGVEVGGLTGESAGSGKPARIVKAVNMRARGQKGAKVLGVLPAGTAVSLYGCQSWCEISYNGRKGWVYKSFVGSAAAAESSAADKQASADEAPTGSDRFVVKSQRGGDR
ncbi:MAG: SH3 domain-containing protein [Alphaproteobacteria bacterium]|nr:SH3 domain-containing protein [Alphaproteobacteria bacterium]MBU0805798.1 SH3 domain-containing protein [Alphaproteobacteria bacterium]MBU0872535.1 SH3 domain-containing protein [Alphaproteobacteria bacterium]MBU1403030.1 SH3 domain-containing protein [Alphaproteobacteria bacterium]MBU1593791.1 SH3 domain-containing protein [Alphaproteobacteria bacterium]